MRPVVIDLFSGAGGMSLGFEQAGFDVVAAVELDPIHAAVHHYNFPRTATLARSITDVSVSDLRNTIRSNRDKIDVVVGGPPCQGFSLMGQRALNDPRNALVREFVRMVVELDASYFVFENVKGLTVGNHRQFLLELIADFERVGYNVRQPWRVLNAASFGVPQNRERLILFGAKRGLALPEYPQPTFVPPDDHQGNLLQLPVTPNCKEALGDLPDADTFDALLSSDSVTIVGWPDASWYAHELRCTELQSWHRGYRRIWNPALLTASMRTDHSDISRRRFLETVPGLIEPISRFFKLSPHGLSNTLRAGTDSARGAFTSPRPIHYALPRCVTVREMARLHGFPDWFRFHETKWHGARQVGNAVPPPLARALADQVMAALGIVPPALPETIVPLGDELLLRMTASQAAEYFGITNPIGARDRKSGAKKRRQIDIEVQRYESRVCQNV